MMANITRYLAFTRRKVIAFIILLAVVVLNAGISKLYIDYYNENHSWTGSPPVPSYISLTVETLGISSFPLSIGYFGTMLAICPAFGDSDPDTHNVCNGPLPEAVSYSLAIVIGLAILYLYACFAESLYSKTRRIAS
jgi:multisubunit Na+/H+ antiporter MnhC subunit